MIDYNYHQNTNNDNNNSKYLSAATNNNFFSASTACLLFMALLLHVFYHHTHTLLQCATASCHHNVSHSILSSPSHPCPRNPLRYQLSPTDICCGHTFSPPCCFCSCFCTFVTPVFHKTLTGVQSKRNRRCRPRRSSATGA